MFRRFTPLSMFLYTQMHVSEAESVVAKPYRAYLERIEPLQVRFDEFASKSRLMTFTGIVDEGLHDICFILM